MVETRVPTSSTTSKDGWSIETALDHILALHNQHREEIDTLVNQKVLHLLSIIDEREKRYTQRFEDMQQAVSKAENATERRFDSVNEFRSQLGDQARSFMPRSEAEIRYSGLADRIEKNAGELSALRAATTTTAAERRAQSSGTREGWGWAVGVVGFVMTLASLAVLAFKAFNP